MAEDLEMRVRQLELELRDEKHARETLAKELGEVRALNEKHSKSTDLGIGIVGVLALFGLTIGGTALYLVMKLQDRVIL